MSLTYQSLLDAMDGIAMILDQKLSIVRVGEPNWQAFQGENAPHGPAVCKGTGASVLNRPVTQFIIGDTVRTTFEDLFNGVLTGTRPAIRIDYRCDAPSERREMRLSVRPIATGGDVRHLLYQSVTLSARPRPAIALFGAPVSEKQSDDILTLCAICARVAWPVGAPSGERDWIEPAEYYRRDGGDVALISHGFCEPCFERLQAED